MLYNAFFAATPHLTAEEAQQFHENFPGFAIDEASAHTMDPRSPRNSSSKPQNQTPNQHPEASFEDTRLRFRLGDKSPSLICPSGSIEPPFSKCQAFGFIQSRQKRLCCVT